MLKYLILLFGFVTLTLCQQAKAHDDHGQVTYLANEGIMVTSAGHKVLFDPFFHNDYNNYQLVPADIVDAIMNDKAPYDNIDAIFVSHAHEDHFAARDMVNFLSSHPEAKLIAPDQAIEQMLEFRDYEKIKSQITSIALSYGDEAITFQLDGLSIDALRIPHAGWPSRANVSNIVYRVSLEGEGEDTTNTVIHMGDADPEDDHFRPYKALWQMKTTQRAFPPFWFFLSAEGRDILDTRINAINSTGIHVPVILPKNLKESGRDFFYKPSETRPLHEEHSH